MIELYRFAIHGEVFAYTTSSVPEVHAGETYEPSYVERDRLNTTESIARSSIKIQLPRDAGIATRYVALPPTTITEVQVYAREDEVTGLIYLGRLMTVARSGSTAVLSCEPIYTSLKTAGLRRRYQRLCPYALYDEECGVDPANFQVSDSINAIASNTVTATAFSGKPDGWFVGGYVEAGSGPERRSIVAHSGDTLTLTAPLLEPQAGDPIDAYAGCDHTKSTCKDKFNNIANHGGLPWIPRKNPFGTDPVY